jgi:uncharacterized protein
VTTPLDPDLESRLRFLQAPASHGVRAGELSWIETHMSWLFFAGDRVLKLKKPVHTRYLDFSSVAAREFDCREELRLNSRLAPGVYLGLSALQQTPDGYRLLPETDLPAPGQTVDWLVRMRRLPEPVRLDHRIACLAARPADIDALAAVLSGFYRAAAEQPLPAASYLRHFESEQAINREVLLDRRWTPAGAARALDGLDAALAQQADALGERAAGHLREGHGDLRPEHVFLLDPPVVIDCLEFNPALRCVDPFDEVAFLGLECEMAGAPWVGPRLHGHLAAALGGAPGPALMRLYVAARALLRARLSLAHLLDERPRTPERWRPLAARYIERTHELSGTVPQRGP